jgi:hypothetical protein
MREQFNTRRPPAWKASPDPATAGRAAVDENAPMTAFYWTMAVLIGGTFVPAALYLLLYAVTGEYECQRRARLLWNLSRVFALFGVNILIWGHVLVGLWQIWFG